MISERENFRPGPERGRAVGHPGREDPAEGRGELRAQLRAPFHSLPSSPTPPPPGSS